MLSLLASFIFYLSSNQEQKKNIKHKTKYRDDVFSDFDVVNQDIRRRLTQNLIQEQQKRAIKTYSEEPRNTVFNTTIGGTISLRKPKPAVIEVEDLDASLTNDSSSVNNTFWDPVVSKNMKVKDFIEPKKFKPAKDLMYLNSFDPRRNNNEAERRMKNELPNMRYSEIEQSIKRTRHYMLNY